MAWVCTVAVEEHDQIFVGNSSSFFPLVIRDKTDVSDEVKEAQRMIQ